MRKQTLKNILISVAVVGLTFTTITPANANVTYTCAGAKATIVSSKSSVTGTEGNDIIVLLGSTGQTVNSGGGVDTICGTKYNDVINAGAGNDIVYGNDGDDLISGSGGNDTIYGNNGIDRINGGEGNDLVYAGAGNDIIEGAAGADSLYGDSGNDSVTGNAGDDKLYGGVGNDKVYGGTGKDNIKGDAGDDSIYGEDDNDLLYGGAGKDASYGGKGNDKLYGQDDADKLYGAAGNDILAGGKGDDVLDGGDGVDTLNGNEGANKITGGKGADKKTLGAKDANIDPESDDIIDGATDGGNTDTPSEDIPVVVPEDVKTLLTGVKAFMDKAVTQKNITGAGWQNVVPDSSGNVFPSLGTATLNKITWNLSSNTYCVSIKKAAVNYKLVVKSINTTPVTTISGGSCSDDNKSITAHSLLVGYFGVYSDYFSAALNNGGVSLNGNSATLPVVNGMTAPSYELITNVRWKTVTDTSTNVTTTKLILSGSVDGVNYFRNVIVFTEGLRTSNTIIAGIVSSQNLN